MQKSFSVANPKPESFPLLKELWAETFGDSDNVINNFFEKTAKTQNIFCVFHEGKPVSVLYAIDSVIALDGKEYKAYYVYAVCTKKEYRGMGLMKGLFRELEKVAQNRGVSYLFLVPAEESLFGMYEKIGFKVGFTYKEQLLNSFSCEITEEVKALSFNEYKAYRNSDISLPSAILNEEGFESFYKPVESVCCFSVDDTGYAVFENDDDCVVVYELFGDKNILLSQIFKITNAKNLMLRGPCTHGGKPFGMVKSIDGSPYFENGFFGVPYGG